MINDETKLKLAAAAIEVQKRAYAPYSGYKVGAALLTESGRIYAGVNIENAAYPVTICAERVAVFKAVSEQEMSFRAIAIATRNGGAPCGSCRQVMAEFGMDLEVFLVDEKGKITTETTLDQLLPQAFRPSSLG